MEIIAERALQEMLPLKIAFLPKLKRIQIVEQSLLGVVMALLKIHELKIFQIAFWALYMLTIQL